MILKRSNTSKVTNEQGRQKIKKKLILLIAKLCNSGFGQKRMISC